MDDRELTKDVMELTRELHESTKKMFITFIAVFVLFMAMFGTTIAFVTSSFNNTMEECVRVYFETPYDVPNWSQEQNVEVNN